MPDTPGELTAREIITRFVEAHHLYVRSIANKLAPDPSQADDLAHEAFLIAMRKADSFDADRDVRAWLAGIIRNVCHRAWRSAIQENKLKRDALAEYMEELARQPPELPDQGIRERLERCLGKLSDQGQTLLRLRYHVDMQSREIAQEVSSTAEAVRMSLLRIRRQLRECIEKEAQAGGLVKWTE
ncbi:MAG: sigma-70 family RNA polymerase sigma factor [Kiritimatiellae bacterium]|nr:sigma-70 family RNA polymerase sigma factor [Kiritimatiellia bacterium]